MKLFQNKEMGDLTPPVAAVKIARDTIASAAVWTHGFVVKELISGEDPEKPESWQVGINIEVSGGGKERASEGDYIVRDMAGDFHVMPGSEFEHHFEEVGVIKAPAPPRPFGLNPREHTNVRDERLKRIENQDG